MALLEAGIAEARRLGRDDLAERLDTQRRRLRDGDWCVLVAGEHKQGKSAFVEGLVGVPVCGSDPVRNTVVPTFVRHGDTPAADLVLAGGDRRPVLPRDAGTFARRGTDDAGVRLERVDVRLPRAALRTGLVLADLPGTAGGSGAAHAASTLRAMSFAQAVVMVTDAGRELTAAEIEFLQYATGLCHDVLCVVTKTDLHATWPRIMQLNAGHLRDAGLRVDLLAVSAVLRREALTRHDARLNHESGFTAVLRRLDAAMREHRDRATALTAAADVRDAMRQLEQQLEAGRPARTAPAARAATIGALKERQERLQRLAAPGARWQNSINDTFFVIRGDVAADLKHRTAALGDEAKQRIVGCDPQQDWAGIVRWLYKRTNEELLRGYREMLARVEEVSLTVARSFDDDAADLGALAGQARPPTAGERFKLGELSAKRVSRFEVGMQAVRGWSLGSVVTSFVATMLNPGLIIVLPVLIVAGTALGVQTARQFRQARIDAARAEAAHAVNAYLNEARGEALRVAETVLHHCQSGIRDYYLDRADELRNTALQEHAAAVRAARDQDDDTGEADLARVRAVLAGADRLLAATG